MDEVYETMLQLMESKSQMHTAVLELRALTPPTMDSMLQKEARDVALNKRLIQQAQIAVDVLPTTPGSSVSRRLGEPLLPGHL